MDRDTRPEDERAPADDGTARERSDASSAASAVDGLMFGTTTIAVWLAVVVALVGFLLLARVTVHLDGDDRTMRVADVWTTMADELPNVSRQSVLMTIYYLSIAATLVGAFAAILLALAARDPQIAAENDRDALNTDGAVSGAPGSGA